MTEQIWSLQLGTGPLVATALHDGHEVREELLEHMALDELARLREEDPYSGLWTALAPTRIVGLRSRFEIDLNRPRDKALYRTAEDAWGLNVWKNELPDDVAQRSWDQHEAFYQALRDLYSDFTERYGKFVVYDLHTYNHRRNGGEAAPADAESHPQVNVGTGTMKDRAKWAAVIDRFLRELADFDFPGGKLDVRENVKFFGGNCARWTHETFPDSACVLSIEFKKFFMDEWTGQAEMALVDAIGQALQATVPGILQELRKL